MFINVPYVRPSIRRFTLVAREIMILTYDTGQLSRSRGLKWLNNVADSWNNDRPLLTHWLSTLLLNVAGCVIGAHVRQEDDQSDVRTRSSSHGKFLYVIPRRHGGWISPNVVTFSGDRCTITRRTIHRWCESLHAIYHLDLPCFARQSFPSTLFYSFCQTITTYIFQKKFGRRENKFEPFKRGWCNISFTWIFQVSSLFYLHTKLGKIVLNTKYCIFKSYLCCICFKYMEE